MPVPSRQETNDGNDSSAVVESGYNSSVAGGAGGTAKAILKNSGSNTKLNTKLNALTGAAKRRFASVGSMAGRRHVNRQRILPYLN